MREMVARTVARSRLVGLTINSTIYHALSAASNEDAEQYVQMTRLRSVFSIDTATGSDLDERAKEIMPGRLQRRRAIEATSTVIFSRPGTAGTITIPVGSLVGAADAAGTIRFRTTAAGSILNGNTASASIPIVAVEAGTRASVAAGTIVKMVTRIAGATTVTNPVKVSNGIDRESDAGYRSRIQIYTQALSRGTPWAIEGFARQVLMSDGRRVIFAHLYEPAAPTGTVTLYIDDGTGALETYDSSYIGTPDTLLASALGGETNIYTSARPIRDDGSFVVEVNGTPLVRGTDYALNTSLGQIELSTASFPTGLAVADLVEAEYRFYTGLIREVQKVIDGDPSNRVQYPGVRASGIQVVVLAAAAIFQTIDASISVLSGFDPDVVAASVVEVLQDYVNTLNIGADVIVSEIIERAMSVTGMYNFRLISLSGAAADQVILDNQVARIASAGIAIS